MSWFIFYLIGVLLSALTTTYIIPYNKKDVTKKQYVINTLLTSLFSWVWLTLILYIYSECGRE